MNIANHMVRAGLAFGDNAAIAEGTAIQLNYRELANRVARLAGALTHKLRLDRGDRVALILNNSPQYIELMYACWHAGLIVVPVNAKLHKSDFAYILKHSGAVLCFTSAKLVSVIGAIEDCSLKISIQVESEAYRQLLGHTALEPVICDAKDPAWLFYTSGTTGRAKGAILSHRNLMVMCQCYFSDVDRGAPWRSILHAAPMSHGSGLYGLAHVVQGSCHVIPVSGGFDPAEIFQLIEHWPDVVFFAAPTMVKRLVEFETDADTSNL